MLVNIKAVTGGIIVLEGKASNQDVVIMTGGILESKDLVTDQTTISVSAGGNAEIYATVVDAKVKQEALYLFMVIQNKLIKDNFRWYN
jgi:hypothetical protein